MKRWAPWLIVVVGLCFVVFSTRSESPRLLLDTDTQALIAKVREVDDPLAWFKGDWPLENHFYRPISTLAFEADLALSGGSPDPAQFGRTNALLAVGCILLCFWFLREVTDSPWMTGVGTAVFALWHLGDESLLFLAPVLRWMSLLCWLGLLRGGKDKVVACFCASMACVFMSFQLAPVNDFAGRIVTWLPGRTASVMTVFALVALACYSRFVRTTGARKPSEATATDVPATRSTQALGLARMPWLLLVACLVALALALGSYEQAVMVPALLIGVWLVWRLRGVRSGVWPVVAAWVVLGAYLVLRSQLVPGDASAYQAQQFRSGSGLYIVLGAYLAPSVYPFYATISTLDGDWLVVVVAEFWMSLFLPVGNFVAFWRGWSDRNLKWPFVGLWLMSIVAFLPMAWLKAFGHYHYFPSVFRAGYVVVLGAVVYRLLVSAASLPELQAPRRRDPAPGSLLRQ